MTGALWLLPALALAAADAEPRLGRLALVERQVERAAAPGGPWRPAAEGGWLSAGESLRTGAEGLARVELPWMALTLSPSSQVSFPDALVLAAALEAGRAVVEAERQQALKLVTAEAELRGRGRAVVRREGGRTLVTCLSGGFQVSARRGSVALAAGEGTIVDGGGRPEPPSALPPAPGAELWPARDPVYATAGGSVELRWRASGASFQVELLAVGSEVVLLQRDVGKPPVRITVPWEGAFRWRVSARDARGLEGKPSPDGWIAAVER